MLSVTVVSLPLAFLFEGTEKLYNFEISNGLNAMLGIIFMGVFSTTIGFIFQVKSQKVLKGHIAGLIFLVESPIAAVLGFFVFNEGLSLNGILGCLIIGLSTVLVLLEGTITSVYRQKFHSQS
jgi:drug/metabolite transporter (DMT)-like permease